MNDENMNSEYNTPDLMITLHAAGRQSGGCDMTQMQREERLGNF